MPDDAQILNGDGTDLATYHTDQTQTQGIAALHTNGSLYIGSADGTLIVRNAT